MQRDSISNNHSFKKTTTRTIQILMKKQLINPWQWQDAMGYSQAVSISQSKDTLYCAGQASMAATGAPVEGDMQQQLIQSLENVKTVVTAAGYELSSIARLNFYTTSVPDFMGAYVGAMAWMKEHHINAACTLLGVTALAFPQLLVEIEATSHR